MDNVFIERLWRSIKYEDIYLKEYATIPELKKLGYRLGLTATITGDHTPT